MVYPLTSSQAHDLSLAQPSLQPLKQGSYKKMFRCIATHPFYFPEGIIGFSKMRHITVQEFVSSKGSGIHLFQFKSDEIKGITFVSLPLKALPIADQFSPLFIQARTMLNWSESETSWVFLLSPTQSNLYTPATMVANCRGPIALNMSKKIGVQAIIHEKSIPTHYRIGSFTNHL